MASNALPSDVNLLLAKADAMAAGLHDHEMAVGILQHTEMKLRANIAEVMSKRLAYDATIAAGEGLYQNQSLTDNYVKTFIKTTKNVLAATFGSTWSQVWEPTGFPNQSLAVPTTLDERLSLLGSLKMFLTANPGSANAPLNVTAARATILFEELSDARNAINANLTLRAQKKLERETAVTALRVRMRGVIDELDSLLEDDDPKWYQFGLVPPGEEDAPEVVTNLILTAGPSPGMVLGDWPNSARAAYYRVYAKVVGVDDNFHLVASPSDSDCTLTGLPSGSTVQIYVVAVGETGLVSPLSEIKQIVVP